jgi:hypothetical protein
MKRVCAGWAVVMSAVLGLAGCGGGDYNDDGVRDYDGKPMWRFGAQTAEITFFGETDLFAWQTVSLECRDVDDTDKWSTATTIGLDARVRLDGSFLWEGEGCNTINLRGVVNQVRFSDGAANYRVQGLALPVEALLNDPREMWRGVLQHTGQVVYQQTVPPQRFQVRCTSSQGVLRLDLSTAKVLNGFIAGCLS